jgi:uncharacterized RDD family membrane protein YckC
MYKPKPNIKKRTWATFLDYVIIWIFSAFYIYTVGHPNDEGGYTVSGPPTPGLFGFWFCYLVLTEAFRGATMGHMIFKLEVVSADNQKLSIYRAFKRRMGDIIDIHMSLSLVARYLIIESPFHQRLGDKWARTFVIDKTDLEQRSDIRFDFETKP